MCIFIQESVRNISCDNFFPTFIPLICLLVIKHKRKYRRFQREVTIKNLLKYIYQYLVFAKMVQLCASMWKKPAKVLIYFYSTWRVHNIWLPLKYRPHASHVWHRLFLQDFWKTINHAIYYATINYIKCDPTFSNAICYRIYVIYKNFERFINIINFSRCKWPVTSYSKLLSIFYIHPFMMNIP